MKRRDLKNLLNNAAAVIETGGAGLSPQEIADLVDDLLAAAVDTEPPAPKGEWRVRNTQGD